MESNKKVGHDMILCDITDRSNSEVKDGHFGHLFVHFTQSKIQHNVFSYAEF